MAGVQNRDLLSAQASGLREWHRYIVSRYCGDCRTALEVGCGRGDVMSNISDLMIVKGVDLDRGSLNDATDRGLDVLIADGEKLPFGDGRFDLVYCSFYILWAADIGRALREMVRTAGRSVLFLSEPIWSKAVHIDGAGREMMERGIGLIRSKGGRPDSGLELLSHLACGTYDFRFGTVPLDTSLFEMRKWVDIERGWAGEKGEHGEGGTALFSVPFVWACIDLR